MIIHCTDFDGSRGSTDLTSPCITEDLTNCTWGSVSITTAFTFCGAVFSPSATSKAANDLHPAVSHSHFRRFCDAQQLGLAQMRGEDLEADGEVFPAVEVGGAAGDGNAGDAGEVGGYGENV